MRPDTIEDLLRSLQANTISVAEARRGLLDAFSYDLEDADIDGHRHVRTGLPEVVFARHKTAKQTKSILDEMFARQGFAFATHVKPSVARLFDGRADVRYNDVARTLSLGSLPKTASTIGVVCAGTSDVPVLEEIVETLDWLGHTSLRFVDAGIAGIHRVMKHLAALRTCDAVAVVAGMDGALPGVVAGLVDIPVVAVPTSVGYGVAAGGITALLTMLSSCAPGIAVVNIDNGFGAAALLHRIVGRT